MSAARSSLIKENTSRLLSLDVFRGVVIAGMILVTDPGSYDHTWHQLRHATWNGATATDMIFPAFLLMVGLAIPFSLASRAQQGAAPRRMALGILRRGILLLVLGLAVNGFPDYDWHALRLPGILQRIAVCYVICAFLYLLTKRRTIRERTLLFSVLGGVLLAGYWAMLKLVPVPGIGAGHLDSYGALPAYVDRSVFGVTHLWQWGIRTAGQITYDPEGMLSTIPALVPMLAGMVAGDWVRSARSEGSLSSARLWMRCLLVGLGLFALGLLAGLWLPINKPIFTSSFALVSTGVCLVVFSVLYAVIDVRGMHRGLTPALIFGTNAVLAFVLSGIITTLLDLVRIDGMKLHAYLYQHAFATWLPPTPASHMYALAIVLFNGVLLYPLYRRRIFLRLR